MKSNFSKNNFIIAISTIAIIMCTLLFTVRIEELAEPKEELDSEIFSISYTAAKTPTDTTGDNEREDICKWAKAQKGIKESSGTQTPFHAYFGQTNIAWCQLFVNWCSYMVSTIPDSNFVRKLNGSNCFSCVNCYDQYDDLGGKNRQTTSSSGIEKGWVRYEYAPGKGNHAALYVGGDQYAHGNWSNAVHVTASSGMGNLKGFGKPYYRSKVYYNTNQTGASFNGYTYPNTYSTWYTEETAFPLASSGPTCSGKTFAGWHTTSACTTKITSIPANERGAQTVYAKWSGGSITVTPTPTPTITDEPSEEPTEEPEQYWNISHYTNGGYFTGSYPTWYKEGVGCSIPQNNVARTGYTFKGWYDYSYGYRYAIYSDDTGDKYLYAQWTPNKYPLNLYTKRGKVKTGGYSFTDLGNYYYKYRKQYTYDTIEYLPTQPYGIDRRGHSFEGWYKNSSFTGPSYTNLPKGTIGEQTFYAKWEPLVYDLILHKNGGTCVNPRIDDGIVVGDDIIGTYTYAKGSTFPKANDDIYKKDRIFAGWYDNSSLSGTPQTGIRSGDDDTAPIGDKEYWARWLGIIPNTPANDATEVVNNELLLYVYYTYRIDTDESGNVIQRVSTPTAENKRHFSVDLAL